MTLFQPKQSTCYWPDNLETDNQREFEDFIVTLKKRDVQQDYVDCTLEIIDIEVYIVMIFLILPEPSVVCLCRQYRARPACTSVQSDLTLYC